MGVNVMVMIENAIPTFTEESCFKCCFHININEAVTELVSTAMTTAVAKDILYLNT